MITTSVGARVLEGFDDSSFGYERWDKLLGEGSSADLPSLTWAWQRTWWESYGRGELLLIAIERNGQVLALAPFYAHRGMVSLIGSGNTDYVDFIGDMSDPDVLDATLKTVIDRVSGFRGFTFYYVRDSSEGGKRLAAAAERLGLSCYEEGEMPAPAIDISGNPDIALAATSKKSLLRHERFFHREGKLEVHHMRDGAAILPNLEEFFEQHVARWAVTSTPSRFLDPGRRAITERMTRACANAGWLRFTRIDWEGRPIAFHYGSCYRGRYYFGTPTFAIDLARHSPGEVLLRQLLIAAIEEGAHTFDFGIGDEAFKLRFATHINYVRSWGLYPSRSRTPLGGR